MFLFWIKSSFYSNIKIDGKVCVLTEEVFQKTKSCKTQKTSYEFNFCYHYGTSHFMFGFWINANSLHIFSSSTTSMIIYYFPKLDVYIMSSMNFWITFCISLSNFIILNARHQLTSIYGNENSFSEIWK